MREKLPRTGTTDDLRAAATKMLAELDAGKSVEEVLSTDAARSLARTVADITKDATTRPISAPRPRVGESQQSSTGLPPRGGRGSGPAPVMPTLGQTLKM